MNTNVSLISVIILAKNEEKNIGKTLQQIYKQILKTGILHEVILIDSGSKDKTIEIASKFPIRIHEIKPEEFGHGKTRNLGMDLATGDILIFNNADAIPANKYWLEELIKFFRKHPKLAGVYSRQISKNPKNMIETHYYNLIYPENPIIRKKAKKLTIDNIRFSTVSCAIKKDLLKEKKFLSNIWQMEDMEWAGYMIKQGYQLFYNPKSKVFHSHFYKYFPLAKRSFELGYVTHFITKKYNCGNEKRLMNYFLNFGALSRKNQLSVLRRVNLLFDEFVFKIIQSFFYTIGWYVYKLNLVANNF